MSISDELILSITGRDTGLGAAVSTAQGQVGGLTGAIQGAVSGFGAFGLAAAGVKAVGEIIGNVAGALGSFVDAATESQDTVSQLNAVLRSTHEAAGVTAQAATDLATSLSAASGLSKFGDEAVLSAENLLLTFTKISGQVFPEATQAAVDMAAALGGDPVSKATMLGKALQDPVAGISALQRVGVSFSDSQKEVIKQLVATGDVAGAQRIILAELSTEFGGSAAASAQTFSGRIATAKDRIGEMKEAVGTGLLPILTQAVGLFNSSVIPVLQSLADKTVVVLHGLNGVVTFLTGQLPAINSQLSSAFQSLTGASSAAGGALSGLRAVVQQVAQAFQVGGLQGAISAVAGAIPQFVTTLGQARFQIVETLAGWAAAFVSWVGPAIPGVVAALGELAGALFAGIIQYGQDLAAQLMVWGGKFLDWLLPILPEAVAQVAQWGSGIVSWILDTGIPMAATALGQLGQQLVAWIGPRLPDIAVALGQIAQTLVTFAVQTGADLVAHLAQWGLALISWIGPQIGPFVSQLGTFAQSGLQWLIGTGLPQLIQSLLGWAAALIGWIGPAIPGLLTNLGEFAVNGARWLVETGLPMFVRATIGLPAAITEWVRDATIAVWPKLETFGQQILHFLEGALPMIGRGAMNMGIGLINGVIRGINDNAQGLIDGLMGVVNAGIDAINQTFGTNLPRMSAHFARLKELPMLAGPGFEALSGLVDQTFTDMGDEMDAVTHRGRDFAQRLPDTIAAGTNALPGVSQPGLDDWLKSLTDAFQGGVDAGNAAVPPLTTAATNAGNGVADGLGGGSGGGKGTKGAKKQTEDDIAAIVHTITQGLGQAATATTDKGAGIATALSGLLGLMDDATKAKMPQIAGTIQQWVQAAAAGVAPPAKQVHDTVIGWLQALATDSNPQIALYAQSVLDGLTRAADIAGEKSDSLAQKVDAATLRAQQSALTNLGKLATDLQNPMTSMADVVIEATDLIKTTTDAKMPAVRDTLITVLQQAADGGKTPMTMLSSEVQAALQELVTSGDFYTRAMAQRVLDNLTQAQTAATVKAQQLAQGVVQALGSLGNDVVTNLTNVPQTITQVLGLANAAANAGMGDLAGQMSNFAVLLQQGSSAALNNLIPTVRAALQQLVNSTDQQTSLMAQAALVHFNEMAATAAQKSNEMAATTAANLQRMALSVGQGFAQAATAAAGGTQSVLSILQGMYPLIQAATDAGMGDVAAKIQGWLAAAAAGTPPPMAEVQSTITAFLTDAANSGDVQMALLARTTLEHLQEMADTAAQKGSEFKSNLSGQMGAAHTAACGETSAIKDCVTGNLSGAAAAAAATTGGMSRQTAADMGDMSRRVNEVLTTFQGDTGRQMAGWQAHILNASALVRDHLPPELKTAGDLAVDGLLTALDAGLGPVYSASAALGQAVSSAFGHVLQMESPSKVMWEHALNIWRPIVSGTEAMRGAVVAAVQATGQAIADAVPTGGLDPRPGAATTGGVGGPGVGVSLPASNRAFTSSAAPTNVTVNVTMTAPVGADVKAWAKLLVDAIRIEMQTQSALGVRG